MIITAFRVSASVLMVAAVLMIYANTARSPNIKYVKFIASYQRNYIWDTLDHLTLGIVAVRSTDPGSGCNSQSYMILSPGVNSPLGPEPEVWEGGMDSGGKCDVSAWSGVLVEGKRYQIDALATAAMINTNGNAPFPKNSQQLLDKFMEQTSCTQNIISHF